MESQGDWCEVIIKNLQSDITYNEIKRLMSRFKTIGSINTTIHKERAISVIEVPVDKADAVVEFMNGKKINDYYISASIVRSKEYLKEASERTVRVSNIERVDQMSTIKQIICEYIPVKTIIPTFTVKGEFTHSFMVELDDSYNSQDVLQQDIDMMIDELNEFGKERGIVIERYSQDYKEDISKCNVFVKEIPEGWKESNLRTYCLRYGDIKNVTMIETKGCGIVNFLSPKGSKRAVEENTNNPLHLHFEYYKSPKEIKGERISKKKQAIEEKRVIVVKNLLLEYDEEKLKEIFARKKVEPEFIHCPVNRLNEKRRIAFITCSTSKDASTLLNLFQKDKQFQKMNAFASYHSNETTYKKEKVNKAKSEAKGKAKGEATTEDDKQSNNYSVLVIFVDDDDVDGYDGSD